MKRISFRRGQIVQDHNGVLYIFIKRRRKISDVLELDAFGEVIAITEVITSNLSKPYNIPKNFKIIEI